MTVMYGVHVERIEDDRLRLKVVRRYSDLPHLPQARPFFGMLLAQPSEKAGVESVLREHTRHLADDAHDRFWRENARDYIEWVRPVDVKGATRKGTAGPFVGGAFRDEASALSASFEIKVRDPRYIAHLTAGDTLETAAYELDELPAADGTSPLPYAAEGSIVRIVDANAVVVEAMVGGASSTEAEAFLHALDGEPAALVELKVTAEDPHRTPGAHRFLARALATALEHPEKIAPTTALREGPPHPGADFPGPAFRLLLLSRGLEEATPKESTKLCAKARYRHLELSQPFATRTASYRFLIPESAGPLAARWSFEAWEWSRQQVPVGQLFCTTTYAHLTSGPIDAELVPLPESVAPRGLPAGTVRVQTLGTRVLVGTLGSPEGAVRSVDPESGAVEIVASPQAASSKSSQYHDLHPLGAGAFSSGDQFHWITDTAVTPIVDTKGEPAVPAGTGIRVVGEDEVLLPTTKGLLRWRAGRVVETLLEGNRNAVQSAARDGERLWIANSKTLFVHQEGETQEIAPGTRGLPKGKVSQIVSCEGGHLFRVGAKAAFLRHGAEAFEIVKVPKGEWIAHPDGGLFITADNALHRLRDGVAERVADVPGVPPQTSATLLDAGGLWLLTAGALWRVGAKEGVRRVAELRMPAKVTRLRRFAGALWACTPRGIIELRHHCPPRWYTSAHMEEVFTSDAQPVGEARVCLYAFGGRSRDTPLHLEVHALDALRNRPVAGGRGPILELPELTA